jgi:hypothetical protein
MFSKKVACGSFVKRQTKNSGYSHFEGTWEQLESLVEARLNVNELFGDTKSHITPGYRDGVILVDMSPSTRYFRSAVVELTEDSHLTANYAPRRPGEAPFIRVSAKAKKQVAKHVSVVLYRHDVLQENNEWETDAEWEIVAIKASTSDEEEPLHYYTMARNYLVMTGGTKGNFSADDFAKSIVYWNNHAMMTAKIKWYEKFYNWLRGDK